MRGVGTTYRFGKKKLVFVMQQHVRTINESTKCEEVLENEGKLYCKLHFFSDYLDHTKLKIPSTPQGKYPRTGKTCVSVLEDVQKIFLVPRN